MQDNDFLKESTKRLLFEQYNSAGRAYSSQQDSLDKAYTTILFAEIAFYISKITPNDGQFVSDCIAVSFIAFSLLAVFISFIVSKSTLKIFQELMATQIYAMDSKDNAQALMQAIESDQKRWDKNNYILSQLNWHIPVMVIISTALCFLKASFISVSMFQKKYWILWGFYIIISISIIFIIRSSRSKKYEKK